MFNWLYSIFGWILTGIDWYVFKVAHVHNTGLCIVLLTLVIYILIYPLNAKQQKSARMMSKINPEVKKIQEKYKGKKDQASQMKMNEETQNLYAKYGISPFGGCLPLLITFPILWCLYRVMYNIETYVPHLKQTGANMFLGLDVNSSPMQLFKSPDHPYGWIAFIIPILVMVLQFINTKLMQAGQDTPSNGNDQMDSMAQSMKTMNYFMPIMSGFFCLSLNIGIGLYWITGSLFRIVQCILINRSIDNIDMDELIEKNKEKAAKKGAKLQERNRQMEEYAKTRTSSIKSASSYQNKAENTSAGSNSKKDFYVNKDVKPGSISGYANMLSGKSEKDK